MLWELTLGFLIGAGIGLFGHAATAGNHDFSSVRTMRAAYYDLVTDPSVAEEATRELSARDLPTPGRSGP